MEKGKVEAIAIQPGPNELLYLFAATGAKPSFDPEDGDLIKNMIHMDHLVGTLLKEKYGNSGRTEPYLAERWEVSSDGLVWNFYLHNGFTCEDGTKIDAPAFVDSFNRILKIYSKRQDLAAFNRLKGWSEFISGSTVISGIRAKSSSLLQFEFDRRPDGFPEFLAMAFYGFYCENNFEEGRWKDKNKIVASGAYMVEPGSIVENGLTLKKRNAPLSQPTSPQRVFIRLVSDEQAHVASPKNTIIYYPQFGESQLIDGFRAMKGAPIFLTSLVLSPHRNVWFDRVENRYVFRNKIRELLQKEEKQLSHVFLGSKFYFSTDFGHIDSKVERTSITVKETRPKEPLKILRFPYSATKPENQQVELLTKRALEELGWPYEIYDPNFSDPDFIRKRNTNREYDIRFAAVDIGGSAENWVINMMFCSQLAISFPDPTRAVCKLVAEHEGRTGLYDERAYLDQFESIIETDAAVIPLFHSGPLWLFSNNVEAEVIVPTMVVPRFDRISIQ